MREREKVRVRETHKNNNNRYQLSYSLDHPIHPGSQIRSALVCPVEMVCGNVWR